MGMHFYKDDYILTTSEISFVIGYVIGAIVVLSIMLPVNLKFGPEKGRIAMIIVIAIIVAGGFAVSKIAGTMDLTKVYWGIREIPTLLIIGIISVVVLIILGISYLIACKIMKKKEF